MDKQQQSEIFVAISDPTHPHYPEAGYLTGEVIRLVTGTSMAKVRLTTCIHGTDACFVTKGQVRQIEEPRQWISSR